MVQANDFNDDRIRHLFFIRLFYFANAALSSKRVGSLLRTPSRQSLHTLSLNPIISEICPAYYFVSKTCPNVIKLCTAIIRECALYA